MTWISNTKSTCSKRDACACVGLALVGVIHTCGVCLTYGWRFPRPRGNLQNVAHLPTPKTSSSTSRRRDFGNMCGRAASIWGERAHMMECSEGCPKVVGQATMQRVWLQGSSKLAFGEVKINTTRTILLEVCIQRAQLSEQVCVCVVAVPEEGADQILTTTAFGWQASAHELQVDVHGATDGLHIQDTEGNVITSTCPFQPGCKVVLRVNFSPTKLQSLLGTVSLTYKSSSRVQCRLQVSGKAVAAIAKAAPALRRADMPKAPPPSKKAADPMGVAGVGAPSAVPRRASRDVRVPDQGVHAEPRTPAAPIRNPDSDSVPATGTHTRRATAERTRPVAPPPTRLNLCMPRPSEGPRPPSHSPPSASMQKPLSPPGSISSSFVSGAASSRAAGTFSRSLVKDKAGSARSATDHQHIHTE